MSHLSLLLLVDLWPPLTGEGDTPTGPAPPPDTRRDGDPASPGPYRSVRLWKPLLGSVLGYEKTVIINTGDLVNYLDNSSFIGAKDIFGNVPLVLD